MPNRQPTFATAATRRHWGSSSFGRRQQRSKPDHIPLFKKVTKLWGSLPRKSSDCWEDHVEEEVLGGEDEFSFLEDYYNDNSDHNDDDDDDEKHFDDDASDHENAVGGDAMLGMKRDDSFLDEFVVEKTIGEGNSLVEEDENNDDHEQEFKAVDGGDPVSLLVKDNYEFGDSTEENSGDYVDNDKDVIWAEGLEAMTRDPLSLVPNEELVSPNGDNHFVAEDRALDPAVQGISKDLGKDEWEENLDDCYDNDDNFNGNNTLATFNKMVELSKGMVAAQKKGESGDPPSWSLHILQEVEAQRDI